MKSFPNKQKPKEFNQHSEAIRAIVEKYSNEKTKEVNNNHDSMWMDKVPK